MLEALNVCSGDAEVARLELRPKPGELELALDDAQVLVLFHQPKHLLAALAGPGHEGETDSLAGLERYLTAEAEARIEHRPGRVTQWRLDAGRANPSRLRDRGRREPRA